MKLTETEKFMQKYSKVLSKITFKSGTEPTEEDKTLIYHPGCGLAMALDMDFDDVSLRELGHILLAMYEK